VIIVCACCALTTAAEAAITYCAVRLKYAAAEAALIGCTYALGAIYIRGGGGRDNRMRLCARCD